MAATVARSCLGNQRDVMPALLGYAPASPTPSATRRPTSDLKPVASPVTAVASDHHSTAKPSTFFCPKRSARMPAGSCSSAYDQKNADITTPISTALRWNSFWMCGAAADSTVRSM